ncbi:MAG TPA: glycosyltransferase [Acidimicrobiales bacterium]|nr:glycosyltransferase [Acidimicrobiales bacterium]
MRSTSGRPAASIVILAWNAWEHTESCLRTLRTTLREDDEVIVVDNGSTDETPRQLRAFPWVRVVTNAENRGFAGGCNDGAAVATREVIVFLNNDTILAGPWLDTLLAPFNSGEVGATGPRSNMVSGLQLVQPVPYMSPLHPEFARFAACWASWFQGQTVEVDRLVGFCLAVRHSAFQEVEGFDERYAVGGFDDDDLCRKLTSLGWKLLVSNASFVHHAGHATFDANELDWYALQCANQARYEEKWAADAVQVPSQVAPAPAVVPVADRAAPPARVREDGLPDVTIVIPTCNRPHFLRRALASIANQTFRSFEVVVVNDAGSDPTRVIDIARQHFEVRLITHDHNLGAAAAQNSGLRAARGEAICILGDDDLFHPHHLQKLWEAYRASDQPIAVYSLGAQAIEDEQGTVLGRSVLPCPPAFDPMLLQVTNFIPTICLMLPKNALHEAGGFDESLEVLEDWDLWIRLSRLIDFHHLPLVTCEYRVRGGRQNMTTRDVARFDRCLRSIYEKYPVVEGPIAEARRQLITGSASRGETYLYDTTVIVHSAGRFGELVRTLQSVAAGLRDSAYEVILLLPRSPESEQLAAGISGDILVYYSAEPLGDDLAWQVGQRRAAGRHVVSLREGELLPAMSPDLSLVP